MIYICYFHFLSNLLLNYICKLHWNLNQGSAPVSMYGVHAEVCKIAKKTGSKPSTHFVTLFKDDCNSTATPGDPSAVFAFIAMVRSDQTFGLGLSSALVARYEAPRLIVEEQKLLDILPLLYQAK